MWGTVTIPPDTNDEGEPNKRCAIGLDGMQSFKKLHCDQTTLKVLEREIIDNLLVRIHLII